MTIGVCHRSRDLPSFTQMLHLDILPREVGHLTMWREFVCYIINNSAMCLTCWVLTDVELLKSHLQSIQDGGRCPH